MAGLIYGLPVERPFDDLLFDVIDDENEVILTAPYHECCIFIAEQEELGFIFYS